MSILSVGGLWSVVTFGTVVVIGLAVLAIVLSRSPRR
jgi:hypothetical protein